MTAFCRIHGPFQVKSDLDTCISSVHINFCSDNNGLAGNVETNTRSHTHPHRRSIQCDNLGEVLAWGQWFPSLFQILIDKQTSR